MFDPLSAADDSPWHEFFANQELQQEIAQDVKRTYPEHGVYTRARSGASCAARHAFLTALQTTFETSVCAKF